MPFLPPNQQGQSTEGTHHIGNETLPKIIINDGSFFQTAISIFVISNRGFRVLFDKIASVYILFEKYTCIFNFSIGNGQPRKPALCQLYRHAFVPYRGLWQCCGVTI